MMIITMYYYNAYFIDALCGNVVVGWRCPKNKAFCDYNSFFHANDYTIMINVA